MHRRSVKINVLVLVGAVVVTAFVSLYPVLDCEERACPNAIHSSAQGAVVSCVVGVLSAVALFPTRAPGGSATLRFGDDAMSSQICASSPFRPPRG